MLVVDALEAVEVDESEREAQAASGAAVDLLFELSSGPCVVQATREPVETTGREHRLEHLRPVCSQRQHRCARLGRPEREGFIRWACGERRDQHRGGSAGRMGWCDQGMCNDSVAGCPCQLSIVLGMQWLENRAL